MQENCLPVSDQVLYKERCTAIKKISGLTFLVCSTIYAAKIKTQCLCFCMFEKQVSWDVAQIS